MIRALWLKKILKGRSKGVSSVIGTVFLVLVIFAVSTNIFLWTISQNAVYNQAVNDINQKNADRMNENVVATGGNCTYDVSSGKVKVQAKLTNEGSVAAQIINLWVIDNARQTYGFNNSLASNMNPGDPLDLTGSNAILVTVPDAIHMDSFNAWFVTARGNTVPVTEPIPVIVAQVSQGIGSVAMDFGTFVYYHVDYDYILKKYRLRQTEWPNGRDGFIVPSATNIAFRVTLINFDPEKRDITINSHSVLWMLFPATVQQPRSAWWYISKVDSGIFTAFTPVNLPYSVPTQVFFASCIDGIFSPSNIGNPITANQPAAVNLMLIGTIGTSSNFGQNVPFVSVYVT